MAIPKCKECEYHSIFSASQGLMVSHWCTHTHYYIEKNRKESMYAKEAKTSPNWCPKRLPNK